MQALHVVLEFLNQPEVAHVQLSKSVLPVPGVVIRAGHWVQAEEPALPEYVPVAHKEHTEAPAIENDPAAQTDIVLEVQVEPALQATQAKLLSL